MIFAHLGLEMGNGQAYMQFLGLKMEIKNLISNSWAWEWEEKIKFLSFGIGDLNENLIPNMLEWEFASIPQKLGMQMEILNWLYHVKHYVEPA